MPRMAGVVLIPKKILPPVVTVLCVVGTYAVNSSMFDVTLMFFFGLAVSYEDQVSCGPLVLGLCSARDGLEPQTAINMAMVVVIFTELAGLRR